MQQIGQDDQRNHAHGGLITIVQQARRQWRDADAGNRDQAESTGEQRNQRAQLCFHILRLRLLVKSRRPGAHQRAGDEEHGHAAGVGQRVNANLVEGAIASDEKPVGNHQTEGRQLVRHQRDRKPQRLTRHVPLPSAAEPGAKQHQSYGRADAGRQQLAEQHAGSAVRKKNHQGDNRHRGQKKAKGGKCGESAGPHLDLKERQAKLRRLHGQSRAHSQRDVGEKRKLPPHREPVLKRVPGHERCQRGG